MTPNTQFEILQCPNGGNVGPYPSLHQARIDAIKKLIGCPSLRTMQIVNTNGIVHETVKGHWYRGKRLAIQITYPYGQQYSCNESGTCKVTIVDLVSGDKIEKSGRWKTISNALNPIVIRWKKHWLDITSSGFMDKPLPIQ